MYSCVIFDVDGTLLDTHTAVIESLKKVLLETLGREFSSQELQFVLGIPSTASLPKLGITDVPSTAQLWDQYMAEYQHEVQVYEGIEHVLQTLGNSSRTTGIVTSKTRQQLQDDFVPFGLMKYMQYSVCADETRKHKPNPEPILKFLELSSVNPADALYIGDTLYDYQSATGAGVDFALAGWGATMPESIPAKHRLTAPNDLLNLLTPATK